MNSHSKPERSKTILALQLLLIVYSASGILSKLAAGTDFFSIEFLCLYFGVLVILGVYAIGWQQILKRLPLTTAYSNRAVTVVWGILWGFLFFSEPVSPGKVLGACLIIVGIILFSHADKNDSAYVREDSLDGHKDRIPASAMSPEEEG